MIDVPPEQARTLAAIVDGGTFDAAATQLQVTPSAVSQRIRALETTVGRPVLRRVRPVELTGSGAAVVRFARQLELLSHELSEELGPDPDGPLPRLTLVVNADSLFTWAVAGLVRAAAYAQLEILREDQDHALDLLRSGAAAAAVTSTAAAVPGCTTRRLGVMRYRPVCSAEFAARWFPEGPTRSALAVAPVVAYDRKDDLQDRYLRSRGRGLIPPRHHVPGSSEHSTAVELGLGWGMVPDLRLDSRPGSVTRVSADDDHVDVPLYWQQWRLASSSLQQVSAAMIDAAAVMRT